MVAKNDVHPPTEGSYKIPKMFTIHENDAGSEAYRTQYVLWLEQQLAATRTTLQEWIDKHGGSAPEPCGLSPAQESKYTVAGGKLVNRATGKPIPDDEPVFILRAKDRHAAKALDAYMRLCEGPDHRAAVRSRVEDFLHYARLHMTNLKEPDTQPETKGDGA